MVKPMSSGMPFSRYAALYDLIYGGRDSAGEVKWMQENLVSHGLPENSRLLDLGSGTGRHAQLFAEYGHSVVGVEASEDMLTLSRESEQVSFVQGDARGVRLGEIFNCVLALFHVVSYQITPDDIDGIFETAAAHTSSGGLFAFDIWYSPAVFFLQPERRTLRKENESISVLRVSTPQENLADSTVTVKYSFEVTDKKTGTEEKFDELHVMRHFSHTEIALYAHKHGFSVIDQREFLTDSVPSRESWGVWFTLRKD